METNKTPSKEEILKDVMHRRGERYTLNPLSDNSVVTYSEKSLKIIVIEYSDEQNKALIALLDEMAERVQTNDDYLDHFINMPKEAMMRRRNKEVLEKYNKLKTE